ncbi:MAG: transcription elongation factor GreAB [Comamonadaceae bacterium]|nr:MAG: transcription elongation factor GreAB [Comamonadaceae bacterium]
MSLIPSPQRLLTELDHARISNLLRRPGTADVDGVIGEVVLGADLVSSYEVPADVVTMYTQVRVIDLQTRVQRLLTVCYPHDAEPLKGFVSVLSPVGGSLLGLRKGDVAVWSMPNGEQASAEILELLFQPEQSGDYLL